MFHKHLSSVLAWFLLLQMAVVCTVAATPPETLAPDEPQAGTWDFQPQQGWEIASVDGQPLQRPAEIRLAADGTIFLHDFGAHVSYIFAPDGRFIRSFAPRGDGPGEVSRYLNCFTSLNRVVVGTPEHLHFFSRDGAFIEKAVNNLFVRFPLFFVSDQEFLSGPGSLQLSTGSEVQILRIDPVNGSEEVFVSLPVVSQPSAEPADGRPAPAVVVQGLTPVLVGAHDPGCGQILYARSDEYAITVADAEGRTLRIFGLDRQPRAVTEAQKRACLDSASLPEDILELIIAALPDEMSHLSGIQVNGGLIYVAAVTGLSRRPTGLDYDIFAPDGTYLYRARIELPDGKHIFGTNNAVIHRNALHVILEDDSEHRSLARYDLTLPPQPATRVGQRRPEGQ